MSGPKLIFKMKWFWRRLHMQKGFATKAFLLAMHRGYFSIRSTSGVACIMSWSVRSTVFFHSRN
jgi:hypothetical protein